jgi:hypothetical protein
MLRKFGIIAVLFLIVGALVAVPALAQTVGPVTPTSIEQTGGLHFCQGTTPTVTAHKTATEAFLTSTGEVCGAGTSATAVLSSNVEVVRGCITPSGSNQPRGLQRSFQTVSGSQTFQTRSGRGTFNLETSHITAAPFRCPSANMTPILVSVNFTDVTLTVTSQTGTVTAFFPDIDP